MSAGPAVSAPAGAGRGRALVWWAAVPALVAFRVLLFPIPPHDFWWHLAMGREIVAGGAIPAVDAFSWTRAGEPFYDQPWLAQVVLYGLYRAGGVGAVLVAQAAVLAAGYWALLRLCARRVGSVRRAAPLLLLVLPVSFSNWMVRPQSWALPVGVLFLLVLSEWRRPVDRPGGAEAPHRLWLLPLLMALWVNLHGSFVLGGVLVAGTLAVEWARRRLADVRPSGGAPAGPPPGPPLRELLVWGAAAAAAVLANPRGPGVLAYVAGLLGSSQVTGLVTEWAAPTLTAMPGTLFFAFAALLAVACLFGRRRPDPVDLALAAAFFVLALTGERHIVWFALVAAPLWVEQAAGWLPGREPERARAAPASPAGEAARPPVAAGRAHPVLDGVLLGVLLLLPVAALPWVKPALGLPPELAPLLARDTPVRAVEHLRDAPDPPERLFHSEGFGSYLTWAAPELPVFIDTRIELYPVRQWRDYVRLGKGEAADSLLDAWRVDGLLLDRETQAGLAEWARGTPEWTLRYEDDVAVYFEREPGGGR